MQSSKLYTGITHATETEIIDQNCIIDHSRIVILQ